MVWTGDSFDPRDARIAELERQLAHAQADAATNLRAGIELWAILRPDDAAGAAEAMATARAQALGPPRDRPSMAPDRIATIVARLRQALADRPQWTDPDQEPPRPIVHYPDCELEPRHADCAIELLLRVQEALQDRLAHREGQLEEAGRLIARLSGASE